MRTTVWQNMSNPIRIAMWSGPRNLSTAMMRSFSSRPDTAVLDEPFYACYLKQTGIAHPGREQVIAAYESDWKQVTKNIAGPIPGGKTVWYQKHMAHHMRPPMDLEPVLKSLTHAFLIRDPAEVISSYIKVHSTMTLDETGLPYQASLFSRIRDLTGKIPPVVDAKDVLLDPTRTLTRLCQSLGLDFDSRMLHWPAGVHPDDGNWAPHWYGSLLKSTGFEEYKPKNQPVPESLAPMLAEANNLYQQLFIHRL
jgi:hypothetical protein